MKRFIFAAILVINFLLLSFYAYAQDITVAAAANLQFTLKELNEAFEQESGIEVKTVMGASGQLTAQIKSGAPFDIFLSADMDYPQALFKDGLTLARPKIYAYGTLVLWTLKNLDFSEGINILKSNAVKKIAVPSPETSPYGLEAFHAMKHYLVYQDIEDKLVYAESIAQTNQFIVAEAADIGFTGKSIVLAPNMKEKGKWMEINSQGYEPIAQGVVILNYAKKHDLASAQKFYNFLFSEKARAIFKKYGYVLP